MLEDLNPLLPYSPKPTCVKRLGSSARREWNRVAPRLYRLGRLTFSDGPRLADYCESFSTYKMSWRRIYEHEDFRVPPEERKIHKKDIQEAIRIADKWYVFTEDICNSFGFEMSAQGMNLRRSLPKVRISEPWKREGDVNDRVRNRYGSF
ncbi:MAG: P27 family phage terminase small subunit [Deltaproteobacteria bacterium]|nr:P27 family phage terminase small subunit [Deltaproteobacteria bacterium]